MKLELTDLTTITKTNTPTLTVELSNPTDLLTLKDGVRLYMRGTILGCNNSQLTLIHWDIEEKVYTSIVSNRYWKIKSYEYSEYNGKGQITIKGLENLEPISIEDVPIGIKEQIKKLEKAINQITIPELQDIIRKETIEDPKFIGNVGGIKMHHTKPGELVTHVNEVVHLSYRIMQAINTLHPTLKINKDLLIAGAILHDLGKKHIYNNWDTIVTEYTFLGLTREHLAHGAILLNKYLETASEEVKPYIFLLQHILLSHHGKQEYGSPVVPAIIEAKIISQADNMSAFINSFVNQPTRNGITDKMYMNENKPMITPEKVEEILVNPNLLLQILQGLGQYSNPKQESGKEPEEDSDYYGGIADPYDVIF